MNLDPNRLLPATSALPTKGSLPRRFQAPESIMPIILSLAVAFLAVAAKLASTAFFFLVNAPADISSTALRRALFLVSKVTPPITFWALSASAAFARISSLAVVLAAVAVCVTFFARKVYLIRRSGRVLVNWK